MQEWFEELSLDHKTWVNLTRKIKFEKGIRRSAVEKYSDPVHFVYELLQNAEDQGATEACFNLFSNRLIFSHNGRVFTRSDVENITGYGNSDKSQEANKIGRFGIGFKSVFAITERPEIYTMLEGERFAFAIEDLVIPVAVQWNYEKSNLYNTRFVFPFIKGQESILYSKIRERLSSLGPDTMLFLKNLKSIEWQTETDEGLYLREIKGSLHELTGESRENGQLRQSSASYLMFTRNVSLGDEDRELAVQMAFRLDEEGNIIAEPGQKLAVYFPTEQVTGLKFRLHGPFLLTDNRENIKIGNETNVNLIQECAVLLTESIQQIKAKGLLTSEFLSLLPINENHIQDVFFPLYDQVLQTLRVQALLPTMSNEFANATQVKLARGADLRELITDEQLASLYGSSSALYWLTSDITENKTPDLYRFLRYDLKVEEVDPETFTRKLEKPFLEKQTDEWLVRLYFLLSEYQGFNIRYIIKGKPIIRLEDNSHVAPFNTPYDRSISANAYLLREGNSELPLVKRSLLTDDAVYSFLHGIGLSEPDIVDEVLKFVLPPYEAGEIPLHNDLRIKRDLDTIQIALQKGDYRTRHELISRLISAPFLRATNAKTLELAWKAPYEVYSKTDELSIWFEDNDSIWFIEGSLPSSLINDLNIRADLRPGAGTISGGEGYITIVERSGNYQRGLHGFNPYARLEGLEHALNHITCEKALILWNILLEHHRLLKGTVEISTRKGFANSYKEERISSIGQLCCNSNWLPDRGGNFHLPEGLFLTDLPDEFENNTDEARELAIKLGMRRAEELQLADKLGIPHELIAYIQRSPEAIIAWYQEQERKSVSLPSSLANDPDRRREKAAEAANDAAPKAYKAQTINRRVSAGKSEPKEYLRGHNTNAEGQVICQLCDGPMPFKLPSGVEYFEAYQYSEILEKEYEANHLVLCPNCAAEFKHACQTNEDERVGLILDIDATVNEENLVVYLDMPIHRRLRFTQRHLIDLQMAAKDWLESKPQEIEPEYVG